MSRVILRKEASESELNELINNVTGTCKNVQIIYEQIREIETPDAHVRRKVDVQYAHHFLLSLSEERKNSYREIFQKVMKSHGQMLGRV